MERPERLKYIEKDLDKLTVLGDFETLTEWYLEGRYNNRSNDGIGMNGMTPNQVYKKYLVEQRMATTDVLNLMMLRSTRLQKVHRGQVKLTFYGKDIYFRCSELMNHIGEQVYVRYNPKELEKVRIYDSEDRFLFEADQVKELSYFASKDEIAVAMKEQRHYENIVKAYKKEHNIKGHTKALDLFMEEAERNLAMGEELDPDIIRIMRSPDAEFNELCIQQAVGYDNDWSIANRNIRNFRK